MTDRSPRSARTFLEPETPFARRAPQFEGIRTRFPGHFASTEEVAVLMRSIHLPASLRWAFLNNGKAGSSSARRFLFELEFGVPLTVAWDVPQDINSDAVVHNMQGSSGILRQAVALPGMMETVEGALRLVTARHPVARALSAFDYLCLSHDRRHSWFVQDRLRMNALVRFDWDRDPRTATGFGKFLDYIALIRELAGRAEVNPHWRAQVENVVPAVYRPDVIGRVEDMGAFYRQVAERLDQPLPATLAGEANRQSHRSSRADLLTPASLRAIERVYAADFEWLGIDPEEVAA